MASLWQSFVGVLTPGCGLVGQGAVNPNCMAGGTQPHEHSWDHAHIGEGPKPREVQMELRGDPKVRARVKRRRNLMTQGKINSINPQ